MKVLVVENDQYSWELLAVRLEGMGCTPLLAQNAEDGIRLAIDERPDLVLLDVSLSGGMRSADLEGVRVLSALRNTPETATIPIVIHSVYIQAPDEAPNELPFVDGYLLKPFKLAELQELIASVGERAPVSRSS